MSKYRTTLLAPFFSSMAVLSFKKKGKDESLGSASTSLGDLGLNGDTMSLSDLGGGLGTLSKLSDIGQPGDPLNDPLMADAMPKVGDRKLQEVEANVNDLKSHMESTDLTTRAMKGEMDSMKSDITQINESIRTLLNVYEAVSRQYNPFVDGNSPTTVPSIVEEPKADTMATVNERMIEQPLEEPIAMTEVSLKEQGSAAPFDDDGPLDHLVKPDEDDVLSLTKEEEAMKAPMIDPEPIMNDDLHASRPEVFTAPTPATRPLSHEDVYALEQIRRLIDCHMGKICTERSVGNEISAADIRALDLWLGEFKRIGGI